ncbi:FtsQ-type POTRA domain-containing protein [Sphingomonas sp. LB-2]|uniref:cell division protein FtsQ/DivIB n=1 Tax=Sphingomonas caeni TaxID=2984949 RepID=UPI0022321CE0|nr:FtsQ-type POTRA domain-containing protein [Sphingomonas caeni]MCW3847552.1 FtsQ-type POTRA domain-containing protein [Sphingomonas caeni]
MSRKPARKPAPRRAPPKKRQAVRRSRKPGMLDQLMGALPFTPATLQRLATWSIVGVTGVVALGVANWFGVPAMAGTAASEVIGEAGLRLEKINITGLRRMDQMTVYKQALDQKSRAMPLVDLAAVRARLLQYPWVEDARVSRRLPDTLTIHIVEREPAAIWQNHGQLMLIDPKGALLEPVSREAMPDLPLLIGDNANHQEEARRKLMDAAPALKPLVKAAIWIGNRRWDLVFDTGERLMLPEGEMEAADALRRFAEMDAKDGLLGKGKTSFDLRVPERMFVCCRAAKPQPAATSTGNVSQGQE